MSALSPSGGKRPFILRAGISNPSDLDTKPVNCTASALTLDKATHAGRVVTLNRAAGIAVTLPAATGSGDVYTLFVGTTFTGASTVKVANASDSMLGTAVLFADGGATVVGFAAAANDDTIDMLGTSNSTGGLVGEWITLTDVAANLWGVQIVSDAGGTEATPFSATVS